MTSLYGVTAFFSFAMACVSFRPGVFRGGPVILLPQSVGDSNGGVEKSTDEKLRGSEDEEMPGLVAVGV